MMNAKRLNLLERAYDAEVNAALNGSGLHILQTKSALAKQMAEEGYLQEVKVTFSGVTVEGYELTHAGRMSFCMSCSENQ